MTENYSFRERVAITKKVSNIIKAKSWFNDCIDLGAGKILYFPDILRIYKREIKP